MYSGLQSSGTAASVALSAVIRDSRREADKRFVRYVK
jgi:hypothetical protein